MITLKFFCLLVKLLFKLDNEHSWGTTGFCLFNRQVVFWSVTTFQFIMAVVVVAIAHIENQEKKSYFVSEKSVQVSEMGYKCEKK